MVLENRPSARFPLEDENNEPPSFNRTNVEYENLSSRYTSTSDDYNKQFFQVYLRRLEELRSVLVDRASKLWGDVQLVKLPELETLENTKCIIIGTLFKHQQWKPSILRELSEDTQETAMIPEKKDNYSSDKDQVFLEDEMLRVKVVGPKVSMEEVVTGMVCALLGKKLEDGSFEAEDWCFPGCPIQKPLSSPPSGKVLFISGLDLANNTNKLSLTLLVEWLTGSVGTLSSQEEASSIVNLVIAGNSVKSGRHEVQLSKGLNSAKAQEATMSKEIASAIQKLDEFLSEIVPECCVTLMPGQHDPTNMMLPQKPLQRFLLPQSRKYENLKGVSNPFIGTIGNRLITGSSGQPIEDVLRASGGTSLSPLEWLERTLDFRHYCPTAPDTLPSYPFHEKDLFIMQDCPDVYFVGNMENYATKLWKGEHGQVVRLLCIPQFSTTNTAVLLDLKTLDVELVCFGSESMEC